VFRRYLDVCLSKLSMCRHIGSCQRSA